MSIIQWHCVTLENLEADHFADRHSDWSEVPVSALPPLCPYTALAERLSVYPRVQTGSAQYQVDMRSLGTVEMTTASIWKNSRIGIVITKDCTLMFHHFCNQSTPIITAAGPKGSSKRRPLHHPYFTTIQSNSSRISPPGKPTILQLWVRLVPRLAAQCLPELMDILISKCQ